MPELHPDIEPRPSATAPSPLRRPVAQLGLAALALTPAVAAVALALVGPAPVPIGLAVAGHLAAAGLTLRLMRRGYPHAAPGLCNLVTLARLGLTCALLAPLAAAVSGWTVVAVALLALLLDGVDGWLARREGRVSDFGARFDMEVDSALGLVLALNAWVSGPVGPVVLLLGLPRYLFLAAARWLPWMAQPLPESLARKIVCVVQIAVLIALQAPFLAAPEAAPQAGALVAVVALLLGASFGRDILWLRKART